MPHQYGGWWSDEKVERLRRYLERYSVALSKQAFRQIYVDAFAGTGSRQRDPDSSQLSLGLTEIDAVRKGSARIALEIEPSFHEYIFVEKSELKFAELSKLKPAYRTRNISLRKGDANVVLSEICKGTDWANSRAVMFLDPYGMQVDWQTIERVGATEAIDLWYLVPTGMGIARMMAKDGQIPEPWARRLDRMLGETAWRTKLYDDEQRMDLFGQIEVESRRAADLPAIERYFLERLRVVFGDGVAGGVLRLGPRNQSLYMLTFACANPRGTAREIALRIANSILK